MLYLIKSAITLALLYSCFFFFLSKETFHRFNRCMLVGIMLVSLVVPLLHFTTEHPTVINEEFYQMQTLMEEDTTLVLVLPTEKHPRITWVQVVESVYLAGVAVMLLLTLMQALSLIRLMHGGLRHTDTQGNTVVLLKGDVTPFSIFRYIVMNVYDYEHHRQHILTHEQEHIRLRHTYDLLLMEAMKTFQWFNPFVWFISRDLKAVHEYEADQAVINQGIDAKQYQQLLVTKVVGMRLQPFTNNLGHGSLKKRILMMYQKKSNRWLMLKALCAIPVVALAINAFATPSDTDPVEDFVTTLENTEVPAFVPSLSEMSQPDQLQQTIPDTAAAPEDKTPFAIHPVRDQYGRITGFSHEGEPAANDLPYTYEYVFINGRPATEEEVRNYQSLPIKTMTILKTANGSSDYDYKDKHGIILLTTKDAVMLHDVSQDDKEPLFIVDGKIIDVAASKLGKDVNLIEDEDMLKLLNIPRKEDILSVDVLRGASATAIYGEKAKNGAIVIKTKALREQPLDSVVVYHAPLNNDTKIDSLVKKLPGAEKLDDGSLAINGKKVKKITLEGKEVYNDEDAHEVFEICEEPAQYAGGDAALKQFLSRNIRYPNVAQENGIQGNVLVSFIVQKDGTCTDFKVSHNTSKQMEGTTVVAQAKKKKAGTITQEELATGRKSLEEEAIRVCRLMGKWTPAKQRGKVVRMRKTLPLAFRLQ